MSYQTVKAQRLLRLALHLLSGQELTPKQIAEIGGTSLRTAQRDVLELESVIPLEIVEAWGNNPLRVRSTQRIGNIGILEEVP